MQKQTAIRLPKFLAAAKDAPCMGCMTNDGTVVAAHSPYRHLHGGGMGMKCDDIFVAYLCRRCHDYVDGREQRGDEDPRSLWRRAHDLTLQYAFRNGVLR
jgi:hypothetical protein